MIVERTHGGLDDDDYYSSQSLSAGLDQSLNMGGGWGPVVLRPVSVYDVTMLAQIVMRNGSPWFGNKRKISFDSSSDAR